MGNNILHLDVIYQLHCTVQLPSIEQMIMRGDYDKYINRSTKVPRLTIAKHYIRAPSMKDKKRRCDYLATRVAAAEHSLHSFGFGKKLSYRLRQETGSLKFEGRLQCANIQSESNSVLYNL